MITLPVFNNDLPKISIIQKAESKKEAPLYVIKTGDTLTSIAELQHSTVERLWEANLDITDPNVITADKPLKIPQNDEKLMDRPMPIAPVIANSEPQALVIPQAQTSAPKGSVDGNTYTYGYCTWYVKNMRPDLPNNLGNADTWYSNAQAQGFAVGPTPRVGAVAAAVGYMHVALVTAVDGDMVTVSEMNYVGWNQVSSRVTSANEFRYIY